MLVAGSLKDLSNQEVLPRLRNGGAQQLGLSYGSGFRCSLHCCGDLTLDRVLRRRIGLHLVGCFLFSAVGLLVFHCAIDRLQSFSVEYQIVLLPE